MNRVVSLNEAREAHKSDWLKSESAEWWAAVAVHFHSCSTYEWDCLRYDKQSQVKRMTERANDSNASITIRCCKTFWRLFLQRSCVMASIELLGFIQSGALHVQKFTPACFCSSIHAVLKKNQQSCINDLWFYSIHAWKKMFARMYTLHASIWALHCALLKLLPARTVLAREASELDQNLSGGASGYWRQAERQTLCH